MKKLLCGLMALACVSLAAGPSFAATQTCATKDLAGNCIPGQVLIDPSTGLPYAASGGGGGGGSLSAKANASTQTSTEGATTDPLSMDLSRNLRVIDAAVAGKLDTMISALSDTSASAVKIDHTTPGTTDAVVVSSIPAIPAGGNVIGSVGGVTMIAGCASSPCFTTTSATTAWSAGQLIADSTTAASVTKMTFNVCRVSGGTGMIRRARIKVASDTGFAGQSVILYLYRDSPTLTNGDRGAWLTTDSNYLGQIPVTLKQHFSDYEKGTGVPVDSNGNQTEINYDCNGTTGPTGLLVASGTITPQAGSKAVTVVLEALVN